ncbi:glycoside hydrolase family protein [Phenylobacterium sp. J426]|uniref:lysozyme n=1 Tax=Phenylobacterium sp. J426 TaxID=2898439 RepID=UPI002150EDFB|nr:glycoside hydrolase family protein [Phenylobacterium sp. J426]MCR5875408.1 glycoside hydrolase family protein [Phenylobacterium sp. J426]
MRPRYRVSRNAIELIKRFEGCRRKAARLPDGRWTIGYGHTLTAREGAEVSVDDAEALLIYDLIAVAHLVNENVFAPLTQNQFDALVSFAFNLGTDAFRTSQVLARLNAGETLQAACAMELWRKVEFEGRRIVLDALVRRRAAEKALFLTPEGDLWVPAPSPLLHPLVDLDVREIVPAERPTELVTSLKGDTIEVSRDGDPQPVPPPVEDEAPGETLRAAAEAVANRLQAIFPEGDPEPATPREPTSQQQVQPEPSAEVPLSPEAEPETEPAAELRPQADFAPPITPESALEPPEEPSEAFEAPEPANDAQLVVEPVEAAQPRILIDDTAVHEFIPARVTPLPRRKADGGLTTDLVLALLGLAFFGFGLFWGLNARAGAAVGGVAAPLLVAWAAGVAGVGFFVVAVFRLLERLGRMSERD